ncbi:MAG: hypothetical protein AAF390_15495, partial [Pseudomonadota bacterium]
AAGLLLVPTVAPAAIVGACDGDQASARHVAWADPTRTYAEGAIRFIALETAEPVAGPHFLMVLHPGAEGQGTRCALISHVGASLGFAALSLRDATSSYDPTTGLTVRVPVQRFDGTDFLDGELTVVVDQAQGTVTAR